jgi:hypothetical protein
MACLTKWATSLIPFTQPATRVIVVRIRSLAAQTFQSMRWGKDGSVASKYKTNITAILAWSCSFRYDAWVCYQLSHSKCPCRYPHLTAPVLLSKCPLNLSFEEGYKPNKAWFHLFISRLSSHWLPNTSHSTSSPSIYLQEFYWAAPTFWLINPLKVVTAVYTDRLEECQQITHCTPQAEILR